MKIPASPKKLICQAGPFTSDEWKAYMEAYKQKPFNKLKSTKETLERVFNLYLFERGLFIERFGKLYTYTQYLGWVRGNDWSGRSYDRYLKDYVEWNDSKRIIGSYTKQRCLELAIECKVKIEQGGETENLYFDQYKYWRKHWAVDESRFYKQEQAQ